MVYPTTIMKVFKDAHDPFYFVRFLDHIIFNRFNPNYYFDIKGRQCKPLISGVLEDKDTKKKYNSFTEFYNEVMDESMSVTDETVFHHIYFKPAYNLHRLLSILKDEDLMNFTDEKYRIFTMLRDLRDRVKHYTGLIIQLGNSSRAAVDLFKWRGENYSISLNDIREENKGYRTPKCLEFLKAYEAGDIQDLYYNKPGTRDFYKICSNGEPAYVVAKQMVMEHLKKNDEVFEWGAV